MSSSEPLIHLSDVKKVFYTDEVETHALSGIHLDIKQGEYVSIAGPSGCGKSTVGRCLLRLIEPTAGHIYFQGRDVLALNKKDLREMRREMQIIFQDPYA